MKYKLNKRQIETAVKRGSHALFEYCRNNHIHFLIVGISGGLDSAVMLGFADRARQLARKNNFLLVPVGLIMPCESTFESVKLAEEVISAFKSERYFCDLTNEYRAIKIMMDDNSLNHGIWEILYKYNKEIPPHENAINEWDWSTKIANGNIKARLRMITNYHVARMMKGMVLSTDNLSEFWMAFWTICGDIGDFGVIQNILKGLELYDIAKYLGVPEGVLMAKPDDGLGISGGDEDQLGASYTVLDEIMINLIQKGFDIDGSLNQLNSLPDIGHDKSQVKKIAERCLTGSYKRKGTVVLSRKYLGLPEIDEISLT